MLRRASSSDTMSIRLWSALASGYFARKFRHGGSAMSHERSSLSALRAYEKRRAAAVSSDQSPIS